MELSEKNIRILTEKEIEFIRNLKKDIRPSSYEKGKAIIEKFGDQKLRSNYEQYQGPSNYWPISEQYDDDHAIVIVYDEDSGEATVSTQLKFLDRELEEKKIDENNNIEVKFEFVRNGTTAEQTPEENTIWIDVGNKMEKGVIDHHGEKKDDSVCATEMVFKHPELVLQNITNSNELTIVGHILPDFDCVASAYLVKKLAENGELTPEMEKVVEYAKLTDTGKVNPGRNDVKNPYSILNAFAYMPENRGVSFDELNNNIMKNGFKLIDYCLERIKQNPELSFDSPELIEDNCPFREEISLLEQASKEYEQALEISDKTELALPTLDGKAKKVPAVFVNDIPENELTQDMMKNWLRDDGFVFTSIPVYDSHRFRTDDGQVMDDVKTSRAILSVAPQKGVNLEELGKIIEDKESGKCAELGIRRYSKGRDGSISYENRPGYESPDPWYDGRNHNYEIIDSPSSGSVLSVEEINEIAKEYSRHIENATKLEASIKKNQDLGSYLDNLKLELSNGNKGTRASGGE